MRSQLGAILLEKTRNLAPPPEPGTWHPTRSRHCGVSRACQDVLGKMLRVSSITGSTVVSRDDDCLEAAAARQNLGLQVVENLLLLSVLCPVRDITSK